jgi:hypothetical protein
MSDIHTQTNMLCTLKYMYMVGFLQLEIPIKYTTVQCLVRPDHITVGEYFKAQYKLNARSVINHFKFNLIF